jgi:hypothetical protein
MTFSSLILAPTATPAAEPALAAMARSCVAIGARPVVVALPAGVEPPPGTRVVRVKASGSAIGAIRLGMAQLTNTTATAAILWPLGASDVAADALLAVVEAGARDHGALVALAGMALDDGPLLVPRDAWLELVTLGEGGLGALAARRRIVRVDVPAA